MNSTISNTSPSTPEAASTPAAQPVVRVDRLRKAFGGTVVLDDISFALEANTIHGLLGRNGAGKTTLMQLLTGQQFATSGSIEVFGSKPAENAAVLDRICFITEAQRYPDSFKVKHVLQSAPWFFENWDAEFADRLVDEFRLPVRREIKKLSRGQLSAVGVVVGLASRAPLTFFDEPYLGLDAVARQLFYDRLLADYAEHPRTIVLSTHLIDEVGALLERVLVIDSGRLVIDADADELRGSAANVVGRTSAVDAFAEGREVLHRETIGGMASATIAGVSDADAHEAENAGLELAPVSLQQLIVRATGRSLADAQSAAHASTEGRGR